MKRLLKAEIYKILRNKIFLNILLVVLLYDMLLFGILYVEDYYRGKITTGAEVIIQKGFDEFLLIAIAVFIANIIGIDFQTMRIKNIIAKGYSRQYIYLSKVIVCVLVSVLTTVLSRVVLVCLAVLKWGFDEKQIFTWTGLLLFALTYILLSVAYGTVFVMLTFEAKSISRSIIFNVLFLIFCPFLLRIIGIIIGIGPFLSDYDLAQSMEKMATYTPLADDFWRCILSFHIYTLISTYIGIHRFKEKDIYNL